MDRKQDRLGGQDGRGAGSKEATSRSPVHNAAKLRLILIAAGLVLMAGLAFLTLRPAGLPSGQAGVGAPAIGGPFSMVDTDGKAVDERVLQGRWSAVFFGYTYCPDICPATMTALTAAKARMGKEGDGLQTVFVSIDPARDTPAQLKAYLDSPAFPRPVVGLTGSPAQVAAIAKAFKVYYAKAGDGDGYLMDHNSAIYLMDPKGGFVRLVRPDAKPEEMAQEIGAAMGRR